METTNRAVFTGFRIKATKSNSVFVDVIVRQPADDDLSHPAGVHSISCIARSFSFRLLHNAFNELLHKAVLVFQVWTASYAILINQGMGWAFFCAALSDAPQFER